MHCCFPAQQDWLDSINTFLRNALSLEELTRRYTFLEGATSPDGKEHWLNWIAFLKDTDIVIGTFQATIPTDSEASIAYTVFPGFGDKATPRKSDTASSHIFSTLTIHHTIVAEIDTRNIASIQLIERWGFSRTKITHDADFFKGSSSDEYTYSMTLSEWQISVIKRRAQKIDSQTPFLWNWNMENHTLSAMNRQDLLYCYQYYL